MSIEEIEDSIKLSIYVQPRSSKNSIAGLFDNKIKVKLTSPPVDGAANELLIKFLSKKLSVAKSEISIISGEKSRSKIILVNGISKKDAMKSLGIN